MSSEPIAISTALGVVLSSAVAFAAILLPNALTAELQVATIAFGNALIGLGVALWARSKSTPIDKPVLASGTVVEVVTPKGQPNEAVVL